MDYELNYANEYSVISAANSSPEIKNAFNPVVYDKVFYRQTRFDIIFKFFLIITFKGAYILHMIHFILGETSFRESLNVIIFNDFSKDRLSFLNYFLFKEICSSFQILKC
jgi:hypothetical protein